MDQHHQPSITQPPVTGSVRLQPDLRGPPKGGHYQLPKGGHYRRHAGGHLHRHQHRSIKQPPVPGSAPLQPDPRVPRTGGKHQPPKGGHYQLPKGGHYQLPRGGHYQMILQRALSLLLMPISTASLRTAVVHSATSISTSRGASVWQPVAAFNLPSEVWS